MGCVTWLERFFSDRHLAKENFDQAELAAREMIQPIAAQLREQGWQACVGASGTVQARSLKKRSSHVTQPIDRLNNTDACEPSPVASSVLPPPISTTKRWSEPPVVWATP